MSQVFPRSMNAIAKGSIAVAVVLVGCIGVGVFGYTQSAWQTGAGIIRDQPVPFSHEHHVRGLGIDCRYCHTSVETSGFAGLPATKVCMTCHSQIWTNAALLEPVRQSWRDNRPIQWTKVHNLPKFVYFNHSVHVAKGIGCASCHGPVDHMPLMYQNGSLQMQWCLSCHRNPEQYIRPKSEVFNLNYDPKNDPNLKDLPPEQRTQEFQGPKLVKEYGLNLKQMTNCSVCHR